MNRNKTILLLTALIFCIVYSGCKPIMKRKVRKLKKKYNVEMLVFVQPGCRSCVTTKAKLAEANIKASYIEMNCYSQGMMRAYKVTSAPTFIATDLTGVVLWRTQDVGDVIQFWRGVE